MKILCISDQIDPQIYSPQIKERFGGIDMILCAGDLPLDYLDFIVSNLNKPLFFIFGNHHIKDIKHYKKQLSYPYDKYNDEYMGCGAVHLGSKIKKENGLILAGFDGSMRYNKGINQYTEFEMLWEVIKLIPGFLWNRLFHGRYLDILLTHSPPKGIHDKKDQCHTGFKVFRKFLKTFKPLYHVHGHIHLYDLSDIRCTKWENTTVCNAFSHYVINYDSDSKPETAKLSVTSNQVTSGD